MQAAAVSFLQTLTATQRAAASYPLEETERFNWHFIPRDRHGIPLKDLTLAQRRAAHDLLRSVLSSRGYLKASGIFYLESILKALEDGSPRRDPEGYYFTFFGTVDPNAAWGWRVEGHHLSLNYTAAPGALSVTPAFFGANPAEVREGPYAGLRVLAAEEDLGRALVMSLDADQRTRAVLEMAAPAELLTAVDRRVRLDTYEGLPAAAMTAEQRALLLRLVEEYVKNLQDALAEEKLAAIHAAGLDRLYFAWAGSLARGAPHYYRIHGPTVLFEYDHTQNDANHVHTVWRDLRDDFGEDLLRRHYERVPHGH